MTPPCHWARQPHTKTSTTPPCSTPSRAASNVTNWGSAQNYRSTAATSGTPMNRVFLGISNYTISGNPKRNQAERIVYLILTPHLLHRIDLSMNIGKSNTAFCFKPFCKIQRFSAWLICAVLANRNEPVLFPEKGKMKSLASSGVLISLRKKLTGYLNRLVNVLLIHYNEALYDS